jgi:uncharacterized protein YbjT (DUF2867 family)
MVGSNQRPLPCKAEVSVGEAVGATAKVGRREGEQITLAVSSGLRDLDGSTDGDRIPPQHTSSRQNPDPRIVRLSVHQASHQAPARNSRQHAEIEDELASSGLPYTLLRPTTFMQNTLMAARTVASDGRIYQPFKDGRLGMIDARDIGEVAAKVLTEEGHEGEVYTLTGPAAISFYDVAQALSEVLGKEVSYVSISLEKAKEAMLDMGLSEWRADVLIEYAKAHSEGYSDFTTKDVERLTGHPATSYKKFATDFARVFRGA